MKLNYPYQPTCQVPIEILDRIYTEAFGVRTTGMFVEIGAHDGWHWSCTWGLGECGWSGLYVEPVQSLFRQCGETNKNRLNRIRVFNCCIGDRNGVATLGMADYGASSSSSLHPFEVDQYTLDTFLQAQGVQPHFDLLVIDVEGMEERVLSAFDCSKWMPKVIIIERPPPNVFCSLGYVPVYEDWINTIYVLQ